MPLNSFPSYGNGWIDILLHQALPYSGQSWLALDGKCKVLRVIPMQGDL